VAGADLVQPASKAQCQMKSGQEEESSTTALSVFVKTGCGGGGCRWRKLGVLRVSWCRKVL
jgi:hypothetical protein